MSKENQVNRRTFLSRSGKIAAGAGAAVLAAPAIGCAGFNRLSGKAGASAAVLAAPAINVLGANEKILLGVIGPGRRGSYLMLQTQTMAQQSGKEVEFIAVADDFEGWRKRGVDIAKKTAEHDVTGYDDYKKLLENKDVQGVILATPEHQHAYQMIDVIKAGKDMYVEKPMVHTVEEGKQVVKEAGKTKCIIQVGTQRRSVDLYGKANQMVKDGVIGKVTFCQAWWYRNFNDKKQPEWAWRYVIPEGADEKSINWKKFCDPTKEVPFDIKRYFQWRCYWEYSNGIGSDLMVHEVDAVNMVMGTGFPKTFVSSGDIYRWKDGRTTCDTWTTVLEYEEGFQCVFNSSFSNSQGDDQNNYGCRICGTDGTLEIKTHQTLKVFPEPDSVRSKEVKPMEIQASTEGVNGAVRAHLENFVDCMKSRKKPNCDVATGYVGASLSAIAVEAYKQGRRLTWDKKKETYS